MHDFLVFMIASMILYKSCIQLVFSMLGKNFTSELIKTWSLHLVCVLMLGKDFTSELLKTWSLHLPGVLMLGKDFTSELIKTWSLHLVGVLMLGKDFTSELLKTWSLHLPGVLMLGKDFTSDLLKTWSLHLVGVLMLGKDFTSELLKTWSLHLVGVLSSHFFLCITYCNVLGVSCCSAIMWEWPFLGNELTSLGRRSDVVLTSFFFQYISYPLSHTSLSDSLFISQQTEPLSKTIHQRLALPPMQLKNPTLPTGYYF